METKKSKRANLEKFRVIFFQTGLVVSLLFAITLLSWSFRVTITEEPVEEEWKIIDIDRQLNEVREKKPDAPKPPDPVKEKPKDIFKETDDDSKSDEVEKPEIKEEPQTTQLSKPVEKNDYEIDPPVISAQIMPAHKTCISLANEDQRRKCTTEKMLAHVYHNLKDKNKDKLTGKVFIEFAIDKRGKVVNVKLLSGIDAYLDNEVIKAVKSMGDFEPASNNGIPVSVIYTLPVSFQVK